MHLLLEFRLSSTATFIKLGVIDKKNGILETNSSSGQKEWYLFLLFKRDFTSSSKLAISGKTEAGEALEQPARDSLMADENVRSKGCFLAVL